MAVTIHIEQLVLHGFDPRDRHAIGDAIQSELAALFACRTGFSPSSADHIDAGSVPIAGVRSPDAPRAIASAVHREVTR